MGRAGVFVSDARISPHAKGEDRLRFAVSAPLYGRASGGFLGVIVNFYDTRELDKLLSGRFQIEMGALSGTLGRRETLDVYIVNRDGRLVTSSRSGGEVMKQRVDTLPVRECAAGRETAEIYRNHTGREVIGASMCIPRMGCTLLAEIETAEAFAPAQKLRADVAVLSLGVLAVVCLLSYFVSLGISRPVAALSLAVRRVADGDLEVRAPVQSRDEIGDLAASFNTMTQKLIESYSKLINSEARLAHAQEIARVGDWEWDVKKNVLSWSDETYRIFGLGLGEIVPSYEAFLDFTHPDDGARVRLAVNRALAGRESYSIDFRIVRRDGSVRAVHAQG
jgi:PAS domain S-box-containing protein